MELINMEMSSRALLLRICFWIGAIVDGFVGIAWLFPDFWASFTKISSHQPGIEINSAMWSGAALMIGWTVLLLWADRKPIERKGILLITVFPVITGLILVNVSSILSGLMTFEATAPVLALQLILGALFIFCYANAREVAGA
jgi:hypothetical protein